MTWPTAVYPEVGAGGFSSVDGIIEFFGRINAILNSDMTVLDFGAGRGKDAMDDEVSYRRGLRNLKGKVRAVIGADVDPAIASNLSLDSGVLIQASGSLPFPDASFDLIFADYTFEHIEHPSTVSKELDRILKPGGWLCARTPNRWGYIALGASMVPNRLHVAALRRLQPTRQSFDVFRTRYRMNTMRQLEAYFPAERYRDYSYYYDPEPAYFGDSVFTNIVARALLRLVPMRWSALIMVFKRKTC